MIVLSQTLLLLNKHTILCIAALVVVVVFNKRPNSDNRDKRVAMGHKGALRHHKESIGSICGHRNI